MLEKVIFVLGEVGIGYSININAGEIAINAKGGKYSVNFFLVIKNNFSRNRYYLVPQLTNLKQVSKRDLNLFLSTLKDKQLMLRVEYHDKPIYRLKCPNYEKMKELDGYKKIELWQQKTEKFKLFESATDNYKISPYMSIELRKQEGARVRTKKIKEGPALRIKNKNVEISRDLMRFLDIFLSIYI